MRALKRGDFIGVYRGDWFAPDERHCRSDYSFDADDEFVVVPPPRRGRGNSKALDGCRGRPCKNKYPLSRINEPPHGVSIAHRPAPSPSSPCIQLTRQPTLASQRRANATFKVIRRLYHLKPAWHSQRCLAVCVYATEDVEPGEDIYIHYGNNMVRDYKVGACARSLNEGELQAAFDYLFKEQLPVGATAPAEA